MSNSSQEETAFLPGLNSTSEKDYSHHTDPRRVTTIKSLSKYKSEKKSDYSIELGSQKPDVTDQSPNRYAVDSLNESIIKKQIHCRRGGPEFHFDPSSLKKLNEDVRSVQSAYEFALQQAVDL
jgi:hypothetical protein